MQEFCRSVSHDDDKPGFRFKLRDDDRSPSAQEKKEMRALENFFFHTGRIDFDESIDRVDKLSNFVSKAIEEVLTVDKLAIEIRRDRDGHPVDFFLLDGATILRVIEGGYQGAHSDFDTTHYLSQTKLAKEIGEKKRELLGQLELEDIKYVQKIDGQLRAAFGRKDIIVSHMYDRVAIDYFGVGYSVVEQAMSVVLGFMNAISWNNSAFSKGSVPKIALNYKNGHFSG